VLLTAPALVFPLRKHPLGQVVLFHLGLVLESQRLNLRQVQVRRLPTARDQEQRLHRQAQARVQSSLLERAAAHLLHKLVPVHLPMLVPVLVHQQHNRAQASVWLLCLALVLAQRLLKSVLEQQATPGPGQQLLQRRQAQVKAQLLHLQPGLDATQAKQPQVSDWSSLTALAAANLRLKAALAVL
jgi:hypothetical protein